ncbi:NOP5/NOP56 family protein [Methanobacterium sp. MBAC-LM]|uniref:NOP5/NOP56 family protein n=1 Tax=Methanobacterium sp. MBAC-LM TaxID=3412034 RepID=UPI003C77CC60
MKCYLTSCFVGFIILDEDFNLMDYELFPKIDLIKRQIEVSSGNLTREEEAILKRNVKNCDSIIIETNLNISNYNNLKGASKFKFETPNTGGEFLRSNMAPVLKEVGFIDSEDDLNQVLYSISLELTNYKLKEASKARDMFLIQAINAIDEIDEATGKLIERLREWHALNFPELDKIKNNEKYVKLIAEYGDRNTIIENELLDEIKISSQSTGTEIEGPDLEVLKGFAASVKSLQDTKTSLTDYVDQKMSEIAPNLSNLLGSSLGAKLIAHIGGIEKLALLPSSTIQIMGAEKALFRHKKTGERPPKHGLIYQHPEIRSARWWLKGKIARALAAKISLAVRKDVYSGELDPVLKEDFEKKLESIKKEHPFPPRSSKSKEDNKKGKWKKKKKKREKYKKKVKDYY